jgi:Zn-dependent protease
MDIRQNPLYLGFSLGRWWHTNVRVSLYFPLLAITLSAQLGLRLGLAATLVLFLSILFHEFCHVLAARKTGGSGDEILIWPLGGLAWVQPAATFQSQFWTPAVGPLSNFVLFLITLPAVISLGAPPGTFHPIYVPDLPFTASSWPSDFLFLACSLNLKLTLLNLLPIHPLDGSQVATVVATRYRPPEIARNAVLWFGLFLCIVITAVGAMLDTPARDMMPVIFTGFLLMMMSMHEFIMMSVRRTFGDWSPQGDDESYLGYDFSKGYAAFEADQGDDELTPAERRQRERAEQQRAREEQEKEEIRRRVDELLDKVHQHGLGSLTEAERRFLNQASKKYPSSS